MVLNTLLRSTLAGPLCRSIRWPLVAAAAALAGCANLAPPYERPAAPVPAAWPASSNAASTGTAAPAPAATSPQDIGWRDFFTEPRLRDVVALALQNNRDQRVALLNIDKARAVYRVQQAAELPELTANASGSASRSAADLSSSGRSSTSRQYSVALGLAAYELDFFGRARNLSDAALQSFLATEQSQRSTQISLVAEVANAWLTLAADQRRLALARSTLDSQQRSFVLTQRRRELGAASQLDLATAQTSVDSARGDVAAYTAQVALDLNALQLLVGTELPALLLPAVTEPAPAAAPLLAVPDGLPSSLLQQRPDVLAAEHSLQAAHADIGAARAAFFPSITLTAAAGTASNSLSGLFRGGNGTWSFAPSIRLPIFDGGANQANLDAARAEQQIQLASYEKAIQTAFREVADVLATRSTLDERLAAQASLARATRQRYELTQARQRSGADSALDVLDAQRSLYAAEQGLITLALAEQSNRITLYKVLGGGWR